MPWCSFSELLFVQVSFIQMVLTVPFSNDQVNNRDISIAVLRTFIANRKEEHEARLSKKTKAASKVSEKDASESVQEEVANESTVCDEKSNGDSEVPEKVSQYESCGLSEEPVKGTEGKVSGELKPPRVLEVFYNFY